MSELDKSLRIFLLPTLCENINLLYSLRENKELAKNISSGTKAIV